MKNVYPIRYLPVLLLMLFTRSNLILAQDSVQTLSASQVISLVRNYHPIARQAGIEVKKAKADITIARGNFDPTISLATGNKTFNGLDYYDYQSTELQIPTWYGIEVFTGLESLSGNRLDPTRTTGKSNYLGASIPLAKDLVIDKRRAFLQQAKIMSSMAVVQQRAMVNNLIMDAMEAYWQWVKAYQVYVVVKNTVDVYEKRFDFVKKSFVNGERPAIDTTEALAQLETFQLQQNDAWLAFQNAGLQLSAYLWTVDSRPYTLPATVTAPANWEQQVNNEKFPLALTDLQTFAEKNHPDLQTYDYKLESLVVEKKLKFQELLPKLDFQYNLLGKGYDVYKTPGKAALFENNYLYGFKFELPLRFSKGRGEFQKAKLKIQETTYSQLQKRLEIQLKISGYYNEMITLRKQVTLQGSNYTNYQKLVRAEEVRLENGESSLFMVNSRENKALEALQKLIELKVKYSKTIYALQWSAGFPGMQ